MIRDEVSRLIIQRLWGLLWRLQGIPSGRTKATEHPSAGAIS